MFKFIIPLKEGKSTQIEKDAPSLTGMKMGEKFDGSIIGLTDYTLQISGGSDKEGFPMRKDLPGTGRKRALLVGGVGCKGRKKGIRIRKTVRGNRIGEDISQINIKIVEKGKKSVEELLGLEKEEKPKEEPDKKESKEEEKKPEKEEKPEEKKEEKPEKEPEEKKEEPKKEEKKEKKDKEKEEPKKETSKEDKKTEKKEEPKEEKDEKK